MTLARAALVVAGVAVGGAAGCSTALTPPTAVTSPPVSAAPSPPVSAAPSPPASPPPGPPATASPAEPPAVQAAASSAPPVSATIPVAEERTIRLAFAGDVLPHSPLWRGAARIAAARGADGFDFVPMLAGLAPVLDTADLAVCHLETPIAPEGEKYSTAPLYGVPAEIVDAIAAAGFDRCSTASNHSLDRGVAGIDRTVDVLAAAGVSQVGMARTPEESWPAVLDVGGLAVAHLSYTWSFNGIPLPRDGEWRANAIDPDRIVLDATTARLLGADVVVVSLHWGAEQRSEPTSFQREVADEITAGGLIDLVVGHHAHVLQPIERVNGTWVMYGLGNILSNLPASANWPDASQDATVAVVELVVGPGGDVTVDAPVLHPTWVDKRAEWTVRLVADELARSDLTAERRATLERSWDRTVAVVGDFVAPRAPTGPWR